MNSYYNALWKVIWWVCEKGVFRYLHFDYFRYSYTTSYLEQGDLGAVNLGRLMAEFLHSQLTASSLGKLEAACQG